MKHDHEGKKIEKKKILTIYFALCLTLSFALIEFLAGKKYNSLALIADAGHMLTDSISLFITSLALFFLSRPANNKYTYGMSKVEVTAAILNIFLVFYLVSDILHESIIRFNNASLEINGLGVIIVGFIGLLINFIVFFLLNNSYQSMNTKAARIHILGDILGSISAIVSGIIIYYFNLKIFDPIMSSIVCFILLNMAYGLIKDIFSIILDTVPSNIDIKKIEKDLISLDKDLLSIHDLHIWKCTSTEISLTAHIDVLNLDNWNEKLSLINKYLNENGIEHVTIQPEIK